MYAVVETGGKQFRVSQGDVIQVEKLETPVGESVTLDKVLLTGKGTEVQIGIPYLESCTVIGKVTEQLKDKKIIVFKKRRRKNYRRKNGHRQELTRIKITEISEA
tara:strand:+ start:14 stop:328 length:315 start_codon:yes stop_codon:yes gene_type:complete